MFSTLRVLHMCASIYVHQQEVLRLLLVCILCYIAFRLHMYIRPFLRSFGFLGFPAVFGLFVGRRLNNQSQRPHPRHHKKMCPKMCPAPSYIHTAVFGTKRRRNYNGTYNRSSAFGDDPPRAVVRRLKATDILHTTSMYLVFKRKTKRPCLPARTVLDIHIQHKDINTTPQKP